MIYQKPRKRSMYPALIPEIRATPRIRGMMVQKSPNAPTSSEIPDLSRQCRLSVKDSEGTRMPGSSTMRRIPAATI